MNIRLRQNRSADSAFTMVEIALCLAIVGFALVAIVGVLPFGLNVQKENREDTILNQDSSIWIDAIRSGSFGYDDLTNHVDRIVVETYQYDANSNLVGSFTTVGEQGPPALGDLKVQINNGAKIVGLLSTPKILRDPSGVGPFRSNYVYAYVRAVSGGATEKAPQGNANVRDGSFSYRMAVEVTLAGNSDPENILTNVVNTVMEHNLSDVRLLCRWPLKQSFNPALPLDRPLVGNSRIVFRTQAAGVIAQDGFADAPGVPFYFIQPRDYQ